MSQSFNQTLPDGTAFEMILVEGGTFDMGGSDPESRDREKPVHKVHVPGFYIGKHQVTQQLWQAVMGQNPSNRKAPKRPVENVSWDDTKGFIKELEKITGKPYRLPTEAEWEFAARGGKYSERYLYAGSSNLKQVGWFNKNSDGETKEVGLRLANELGIYDMSGNVYEWCEDDWHNTYDDAPKDGSAWIDSPKRGASRVRRGGYYLNYAGYCRPANRFSTSPVNRDTDCGFRLAVPLQSAGQPVPAYP